MSKKIEDMTTDEKIDELLKYQRKLHRMAIIKTILSSLTFILLVVLPIAGTIYLGNYILNSLGLSLQEIGDTLGKVKNLTEIGTNGIDNLKELFN
jgi:predicted nucleic acid-binding Zn ribbon protein